MPGHLRCHNLNKSQFPINSLMIFVHIQYNKFQQIENVLADEKRNMISFVVRNVSRLG